MSDLFYNFWSSGLISKFLTIKILFKTQKLNINKHKFIFRRWDNYPDEKIRMQVELDTLDFEIWKRKMVPVLKSIRAKAVPELDLFALLGL